MELVAVSALITISIKGIAAFGGSMIKRFFSIFVPIALLVSIYIYLYEKDSPKEQGTIVVYTYSSFASSWGPGPDLQKIFKEKTGYNVEFTDVGEAGIIIQRILLEKEKTKADVVVGLDQFQLQNTTITDLFTQPPELRYKLDESTPKKIQQGPFLAYNWSPMTFIYRTSDKNSLPKKLDDFLSPNFKGKIILLDPRTSSPGYIFFHWIVQKYGAEGAKDFLNQIKKNIYTVTPSWSAGYGLFKKKQSQYVFSYLTSPAYHWVEESDFDYQPLYLEEELPYHIEYAGILKSTKNRPGAEKFLEFILSPEGQEIIMNKNYMLPVVAEVRKNSEYEKLKKVKLFESDKIISRDEVIEAWKSASW